MSKFAWLNVGGPYGRPISARHANQVLAGITEEDDPSLPRTVRTWRWQFFGWGMEFWEGEMQRAAKHYEEAKERERKQLEESR